jgi:hypothetical protein
MAKFEVKSLSATIIDIEKYGDFTTNLFLQELNKWAAEVTTIAKQKAPVNNGKLRQSISADYASKTDMTAKVSVLVNYAAYVEFGTRSYAGNYVNSLPNDWQTYASQFKGKGAGGTMDEFLLAIMEWVKDKGLAGTYSVKTQRRTGSKGASRNFEDAQVAYPIALAILRKGIKPHPYLYPAFNEASQNLKERLKKYEKS